MNLTASFSPYLETVKLACHLAQDLHLGLSGQHHLFMYLYLHFRHSVLHDRWQTCSKSRDPSSIRCLHHLSYTYTIQDSSPKQETRNVDLHQNTIFANSSISKEDLTYFAHPQSLYFCLKYYETVKRNIWLLLVRKPSLFTTLKTLNYLKLNLFLFILLGVITVETFWIDEMQKRNSRNRALSFLISYDQASGSLNSQFRN